MQHRIKSSLYETWQQLSYFLLCLDSVTTFFSADMNTNPKGIAEKFEIMNSFCVLAMEFGRTRQADVLDCWLKS